MFKHKKAVVLVAIAVLALASVGAYAYFTTTGSGSGTATVGTDSGFTLSNTNVQFLYPGGPDVGVTVAAENDSTGYQYLGTISGVVADNGGCLGSWFVVDDINYNAQVAPGLTVSPSTNVRMLNVNASQDACKDAIMTINWSSN